MTRPEEQYQHPDTAPNKRATMIDIDGLTEQQLLELNHRIVARLRILRDMRAHEGMLEFHIGDRVAFHPPGRALLHGVLTRYNRKTVTVVTDDGGHWNVAPSFLRKAAPVRTPAPSGTNVVLLGKH